MNKDIELALEQLGYNKAWLNFGIFDEEYLINQFQIFQQSEDKNTEHYRCKAFEDYLNRKVSLSDSEIENCIMLKDEGVDAYNLHENRIHELIRFPFLTDEQFERIGNIPEIESKSLKKIYGRKNILRQVAKSGLNANLIERAINLNDTVLEKTLIESDNIPKDCLELFVEKGNSKAIRNKANSILKSNKYQ